MTSPIIRRFNRFFVCGIDGTVDNFTRIAANLEEHQREYDVKFAKSFVRQLCNGGLPSRYLRGPAATGSGLGWAMGEAISVITSRYNSDAAAYIRSKSELNDPTRCGYILTGYSRGAAGIVEVATRLATNPLYKKMGIEIYAMILFDCVNETNTSIQGVINRGQLRPYSNPESIITGNLQIPSNVANCVHYIRNDETTSRDTTMEKYRGGPVNHAKTRYTPLYLKATHGGLGGLPYFQGTGEGNNIPILEPGASFATNVTMAEDIAVSRLVAKTTTTFCATLGIPLSISV
jgi:hypothetical protein